ncbi:F-box domain [Macleaya cordata]|uniref:F-box domain n=1 Tax=Macleaya cordata TaxID=56857 RepID=A0A200PTU0_MACCD|nr:F-box domain [Macleaya cordata]
MELISVDALHEEKEEEQERNLLQSQSAASWIVILPPDVIFDILTRVSLHHLVCKCRFVCKDWRSLTYQSDFKFIHSQKTPTLSGYFIGMYNLYKSRFEFVSINQSPPIPSLSLNFLPGNLEIVSSSSSSHGLLCCASYNYQNGRFDSLYLCKPATREWRKIPNPQTNLYTLKIMVVIQRCNPLHYKIIRFSTSPQYVEYHCEIFDSNNWEWKVWNNIIVGSGTENEFMPHCFLGSASDPGILVHGAVHWLSYLGQVCALDVNVEGKHGSWKIFESPKDIDGKFKRKLVEWEGEIGLLYLGLGNRWLELWLLEDYYSKDEIARWNKLYWVNLEPVYHQYIGSCTIFDLYTKDIVLMKIENEIIWYNCRTGTHTLGLKVPAGYLVHQVQPFHSDLVPCNLRSASPNPFGSPFNNSFN